MRRTKKEYALWIMLLIAVYAILTWVFGSAMSLERQMISRYSQHREQFAELVSEIERFGSERGCHILDISLNAGAPREEHMRIDLVGNEEIDGDIRHVLAGMNALIGRDRQMYVRARLDDSGKVYMLSIGVSRDRYRGDNGEVQYFRYQWLYSDTPPEALNMGVGKSEPLGGGWYFVKEKASVG